MVNNIESCWEIEDQDGCILALMIMSSNARSYCNCSKIKAYLLLPITVPIAPPTFMSPLQFSFLCPRPTHPFLPTPPKQFFRKTKEDIASGVRCSSVRRPFRERLPLDDVSLIYHRNGTISMLFLFECISQTHSILRRQSLRYPKPNHVWLHMFKPAVLTKNPLITKAVTRELMLYHSSYSHPWLLYFVQITIRGSSSQ